MPPLNDLHRREVLRLLAAGAATALAGCSRPDQPIFPRAVEDEGADPGRVRRYATALPLAGYARGVTGLVVDGRPIKLEGNEAHPASLGSTDMFVEASILDLYDPQRLRAPTGPNGVTGWSLLQQDVLRATAGRGGEGLVLLTGRTTSPTLLARIAEAKGRLPALRHVRAEPIDDDIEVAGARLAFGRRLAQQPRLDQADLLLCLDADPLGPSPDQIALARAWSRRRLATGGPQRMIVVEPTPTQTGACADTRITAGVDMIGATLLALAHALGAEKAAAISLPPPLAAAVPEVVKAVTGSTRRVLVLVGPGQPPHVHALAHWVNDRARAPVGWVEPVDADDAPHRESLATLAADMHAGRVSTLLMIDSDPLHHAPATLGFEAALGRVPLSITATDRPSETSRAARWTVPMSHPLESWGDLRATDGTASIVQPLIRPLYRTRSAVELLDLLDPVASPLNAHDRVQRQWRDRAGSDPDRWWRDVLVAGVIPDTAATAVTPPSPRLVDYDPPVSPPLVVRVAPSPTLWDGRFAANAWAQECPDPLTKEVWGSGLRMAPADARRLSLEDGDLVRVGAGGTTAIRIVAGQAPGVATLLTGRGRKNSGPLAEGTGANAFRILSPHGDWTGKVAIEAGGKPQPTVSTQHQFALPGDLEKLFPVVAPGEHLPQPPEPASLYPRPQPAANAPPQWAMAIDTAVCIGCNACVVACQAENNVPAIGPEEMARGRDMHWLRVDHYETEQAQGFQPVPCMQCETAPCEPVCPVEASIHDDQGLNDQVYNRCVGTRTCQANCPYKVRRFNFLDYAGADLWGEEDRASVTAQRNPDVTVRARGVMEKCTYCVQRIESATRDADANGRPLDSSTVTTACAAACPTRAISFGTLASPEIVEARADPRHYALLGELGTRPRTTYLARLKAEGGPA